LIKGVHFLEDTRRLLLLRWLTAQCSDESIDLIAMSGDAGFRRYFRFTTNNQSFIAVDSPPDKCNNEAFEFIQQRFLAAELCVPEIHAYEQQQGFFWLADLGDDLLADQLNESNMQLCYQQAISLLPRISQLPTQGLPVYDQAFVQLELSIFTEWLLEYHLDIHISVTDIQQLQACFDLLIANALEQPQVVMHRDFHSRNLMCVDDQLAVIDFQDAVVGPITYDIVSLLRDCYIKWPNEKVMLLLQEYIAVMNQQLSLKAYSQEQWQRWFDLMGLQRHIKASGIFARLHHRDGKSGYLADIPLTLSYIVDISANYSELSFLHDLVKIKVMPKMMAKKEHSN